MHDWYDWQWSLFYTIHFATWISYWLIPLASLFGRLAALRLGLAFVPVPIADTILFQLFVGFCGLHHLVMPLAMQYGWFWSMVFVDLCMALVSVLAAIRKSIGVYLYYRDHRPAPNE